MAEVRRHFPVVKSQHTASGKKAGPAAPPTPAQGVAPQLEAREDWLDEQVATRILRAFDLNPKYGPMSGLSRLQRWQRAQRCGLDPPRDVAAILAHYGAGSALDAPVFFAR